LDVILKALEGGGSDGLQKSSPGITPNFIKIPKSVYFRTAAYHRAGKLNLAVRNIT
jgi:hypothetical protein